MLAAAILAAIPAFSQGTTPTPCTPQTKAQKVAGWINRARTGNTAPAPPPCPASAAPATIDATQGAIIDTGTLSGPAFLSGGPGSGAAGYIKFTRGLFQWMWRTDKNQQSPITRIDFGGANAGQTQQDLNLEGMKAGAYYFSGFLPPGTQQVINVSLTKEANGQYTLRSAGLQLPQDLTDLSGNRIEQEAPAPKPSYAFTPYTKQLEDALHQADAKQPGAGLNINQHGGTLSITTNGNRVSIALFRSDGEAQNLWYAKNDTSRAFLIDGAAVIPLIRQRDGAWMAEDGKKLKIVEGLGIVQ